MRSALHTLRFLCRLEESFRRLKTVTSPGENETSKVVDLGGDEAFIDRSAKQTGDGGGGVTFVLPVIIVKSKLVCWLTLSRSQQKDFVHKADFCMSGTNPLFLTSRKYNHFIKTNELCIICLK